MSWYPKCSLLWNCNLQGYSKSELGKHHFLEALGYTKRNLKMLTEQDLPTGLCKYKNKKCQTLFLHNNSQNLGTKLTCNSSGRPELWFPLHLQHPQQVVPQWLRRRVQSHFFRTKFSKFCTTATSVWSSRLVYETHRYSDLQKLSWNWSQSYFSNQL